MSDEALIAPVAGREWSPRSATSPALPSSSTARNGSASTSASAPRDSEPRRRTAGGGTARLRRPARLRRGGNAWLDQVRPCCRSCAHCRPGPQVEGAALNAALRRLRQLGEGPPPRVVRASRAILWDSVACEDLSGTAAIRLRALRGFAWNPAFLPDLRLDTLT